MAELELGLELEHVMWRLSGGGVWAVAVAVAAAIKDLES